MRVAILLICFFLLFETSVGSEQSQPEIQLLKQDISQLSQRIEQLATNKKNASKTSENKAFQWTFGGYVKLDAIYSSTSAGANSLADEFIINALIPKDDTAGENHQLKMTARETRLWMRGLLPVNQGDVNIYMEGDFFGAKPASSETLNNNSDLRLRQAYGEFRSVDYGHFLLGQTWSTFQNLSAFPHATTLGELAGQIFSRTPQVRWTLPMGEGRFQMAAEGPESHLRDTSNTLIRPDDDRLPDIVIRYHRKDGWGNVSLAGLFRELRCDMATTCDDAETGWGVSLAGRLKMHAKDNIRFQASWGDGIGRFVSGTVFPGGTVDDSGKIHSVKVKALMLSY